MNGPHRILSNKARQEFERKASSVRYGPDPNFSLDQVQKLATSGFQPSNLFELVYF